MFSGKKFDNVSWGSLDQDGNVHEVKKLTELPVVSDLREDQKEVYCELQHPAEFSFKAEADPGFWDDLKKQVEENDRKVLETYDRMIRALWCCLQDCRRCRECPLQDDDSCRGNLLHYSAHVIKNHKELQEQLIKNRWASGEIWPA